jgi:hypothetical protein
VPFYHLRLPTLVPIVSFGDVTFIRVRGSVMPTAMWPGIASSVEARIPPMPVRDAESSTRMMGEHANWPWPAANAELITYRSESDERKPAPVMVAEPVTMPTLGMTSPDADMLPNPGRAPSPNTTSRAWDDSCPTPSRSIDPRTSSVGEALMLPVPSRTEPVVTSTRADADC